MQQTKNKKTRWGEKSARGKGFAQKSKPAAVKKSPAASKEPKDNSEKVNLKPGALLAPLPAVMVTVGRGESANIITIGWCGILSTDPPRAYISVRPTRHSHAILLDEREFVINLTTDELCRKTDYAGIYTGAKVDKFARLGLTKTESHVVGAPSIAESPLSLECRVFDVIKSGTHDIFMADIVNVACAAGLIDENGGIRLDKAGLMAYAHGEYFALGKKLGRFGFSATKSKKGGRGKK